MKKIVLLFVSVLMMTSVDAKVKKDPVIMTVNGKDISMSEFIFIAKKDNSVDLNDKKSVENYVELFKNYKLKVADAEALGVNKSPKFEKELNEYKSQLQDSYLSDKASEDSAIRVIYDRTKFIPGFKHILFRFPVGQNHYLTKDTISAYQQAEAAYQRIKNGESFESVGESFVKDGKNDSIIYETVEYIFPLQMLKTLEDKVFTMEPGDISGPVRSSLGFHLIKVDRKLPNPGKVRIAHILTAFPSGNLTDVEVEAARKKSDSIYQKAIAGADFGELAKTCSDDTIAGKRGGLLPYFGLGEMVKPFEDAAFALKDTGDISKPIQTRFGFHILKLVDRKKEIPLEEMESRIFESMKRSDRKVDLYKGFNEKMEARHGYVFHPDAYEELQRLADEHFPIDSDFYNRGMSLEKTLIRLDTIDFPQNVFVEYLYKHPFSSKTYSVDYMNEMFCMFIHDIVTELERSTLETDYPEYNQLVKEYYDGILLFELSNKRVWKHPVEEQDKLESEWIKELNEKYPVTINWKAIKKIKKYLN